MKESYFKFLPEDEARNPTKGQYFRRTTNQWWIVHPEKGLAFYIPAKRVGYGMPQCNADERITRKIAENGLYEFPYEIKFFELVWVPVDPRTEWGTR